MPFIDWNHEYELGIAVIDEQHRGLVDCLNDLSDARDAGVLADINEVLDRLIDYTVSHFLFEEDLQRRAGYPGFDAHHIQHEVFVSKMTLFKKRADAGENVATAILSMLKLWLLAHIRREDAKYVPLVKKIV